MAVGRESVLDSILDVSIAEDDWEPFGVLEGFEASDELEGLGYDEDTNSYFFLIDPTDMTPTEASVATQFLMHQLQQYGEVFTYQDIEYENILITHPKTGELINASVEFTYDVAWYLSDKHPEQDRFAVVGATRVGSGSACDIWKVKGKLKPSTTGTLFYQSDRDKPADKKWVAKYETHQDKLTADMAVAVYELAKGNRKLGLKFPMWSFARNEKKAYGMSITIMRRLKDYDLDEVIARDKQQPGYLDEILQKNFRWDLIEIFILIEMGKLHFSNIEILRYSAAIAIAYKKQVQNLHLIHRDIKAENIIIDLAKEPVSDAITIIDYGFAKSIGTENDAFCGTLGYIAPEILERKNVISNACDIYSLACTLAQWYNDNSVYEEPSEGDPYCYQQACDRQFNLAEYAPQEIKLLLHRMVARDSDDRPTIDEVIEEYRDVIVSEEMAQQRAASPSPKR